MENTFTEGQIVYTENAVREMVACNYVRHVKEDLHQVRALEGQYKGLLYRETTEIFTEKPAANG